MRSLIGSLSVLLLVACAGSQAPVRLQGEPMAISSLTGLWEGEYRGQLPSSRGSITFSMAGDHETAYGDVMMFGPRGQLMVAADPLEQHRAHIHSAQSLRIDFVRVGFGGVTGTLEPYMSPECNCVVTTTFQGNIVADTISGTYTSHDARFTTEGTWRVVRRAGTAN